MRCWSVTFALRASTSNKVKVGIKLRFARFSCSVKSGVHGFNDEYYLDQVERGLVHLVPLSRMEPELSMMMPIETGISS